MPKFIVDLWLDGYDTEEEMEEACEEFINEALTFAASSVNIAKIEDEDNTPSVQKCSVCGTTENVCWVGGSIPYLCDSPDCIPF